MTKKRSNKSSAASTIRNIRRNSRKQYSGEEKIRIVLEGLRGEETVAELCRREGISQSIYYRWSKPGRRPARPMDWFLYLLEMMASVYLSAVLFSLAGVYRWVRRC